jgi:gliding motility-associated-like protein
MKNSASLFQLQKVNLFTLLFTLFFLSSFGQASKSRLGNLLLNKEYACEIPLIQKMRGEGKTDDQIYDFLEARAHAHKMEAMKYHETKLIKNEKGQIVNSGNCSGDSLGVEGGVFGIWKLDTECWSSVSTNCTPNSWAAAALPLTGRVNLVSAPPNDPCGDLPGKPIPLPSPYGGKFSIKLGNNNINAQSERLTYTFVVQPSDANFVYQYAAVLENPASHLPSEQPFFDFWILDKNGDTIPCSKQHYIAGPGLPGFNLSNLSNPACNNISVINGPSPVYYSPWTLVGVHLSSYIGQPVTVVCTTADCSRCGHFGYTYLDFSCGAINTAQYCIGEDSVLLAAPADPNFTYLWTTGATTSSIIANPQLTQTVTVHVTQAVSLCGFDLTFILSPTVMSPAMTYSVDCNTGKAFIADNSTVTGGTINAWSWQFPGGTPSSSTAQNPGLISYPPGTYTVSLTITSQAGCTKTILMPITVGSVPTAQFTYSPHLSCDGIIVNFTDASLNATSWQWNFGDGTSSSTQQNPVHTYTSIGTYNVTLIAISAPCADTIISPVVIASANNTLKAPNVFTPNDDGMNDCFQPIFAGNVGDTLNGCITMEIFDRWGIKIFESNGGNVCWDGKTKTNKKAKDGTYYYLISFGTATYKGYVTLLREKK